MDPTAPNSACQAAMVHCLVRSLRLWAGFNPFRIASVLNRIRLFRSAAATRHRLAERENVTVPPIIIYSATMQCNLSCQGCYSRNYDMAEELGRERVSSFFDEAARIGVSFIVVTGGEPLLRPDLLKLLAAHRKLVFLLFNNGTCIDSPSARLIGRSHNIVPLLSVEGTAAMTDARRGAGVYDQVIGAMRLLRRHCALFGFSTMVSSHNIELLCTGDFYKDLFGLGCRVGLLVGYVPTAPDAPQELLPSVTQQKHLRSRVRELKQTTGLILMQMPEDEYEYDGVCMAAGRGFVHVNARGDVEPCPFAHLATHSLKKTSLKTALCSPLFAAIRAAPDLLTQPHEGCALWEHRKELWPLARKAGAVSTEKSASGKTALTDSV